MQVFLWLCIIATTLLSIQYILATYNIFIELWSYTLFCAPLDQIFLEKDIFDVKHIFYLEKITFLKQIAASTLSGECSFSVKMTWYHLWEICLRYCWDYRSTTHLQKLKYEKSNFGKNLFLAVNRFGTTPAVCPTLFPSTLLALTLFQPHDWFWVALIVICLLYCPWNQWMECVLPTLYWPRLIFYRWKCYFTIIICTVLSPVATYRVG